MKVFARGMDQHIVDVSSDVWQIMKKLIHKPLEGARDTCETKWHLGEFKKTHSQARTEGGFCSVGRVKWHLPVSTLDDPALRLAEGMHLLLFSC